MYASLVFQVGGIIGGVVLVCQAMGFVWSPNVLLLVVGRLVRAAAA